MKFMVIARATKETEAGVMPPPERFEEMGKFNEELVKAGVILASEGLLPSSKGVRVKFSGSKRTIVDGPFTESKELVAGFQIWQVRSKEEALEWLKRFPNLTGGDTEIELRQVMEEADFPQDYLEGMRDRRERVREQVEKKLETQKKG